MRRTRRSFTDELKREAVKLCKQPGATVTHIARDLGIQTSVLRRRVTQECGGVLDLRPNRPLRSEAATEVEWLQRELRRVTTERDIQKSARLLCQGPAVKYGFIARHRSVWPTRTMCRVLAVSHSGFYEWMGRAPSQRSQDDARLTRLIRESFELSDRTYGSPRVWHDLRALGEGCGMNRVIRLIHLSELQARHVRRRLPGDTGSRLENRFAPNHLQRDFEASGPNQKWVADFTYIWTAEGWLYAAAVMDLYSPRIVGWSMSDTMQAKMVSDALLMALWRRGKPSSLMHHSDQGSQGGFNRSLQHLQPGGVYGATRGMDDAFNWQRSIAISRGSIASARG